MKKMKGCELEDVMYSFDGRTVDEVIGYLQVIKEKFKEYINLRLVVDTHLYRDAERSVFLFGDRMETDEEEKVREAAEKQSTERTESYQRKLYEDLKKKFGP
jgi:hypothetical protein